MKQRRYGRFSKEAFLSSALLLWLFLERWQVSPDLSGSPQDLYAASMGLLCLECSHPGPPAMGAGLFQQPVEAESLAPAILHAGPAAAPCHPRNFPRGSLISTETGNNQEKSLLLLGSTCQGQLEVLLYHCDDYVIFAYLLCSSQYQALEQILEI